jgi:hypothetical protein
MSSTIKTPKSEQVQAASRRVFSPTSDGPPYPSYTNAVEFVSVGMDVFMDVGTAHPESIQAAINASQDPGRKEPTVVDVNVQYRFGMTLQTAVQMQQRLEQILKATQDQLKAAAAAVPKQEG